MARTDEFTAIPNSEYDPALRPRLLAPTAAGGRVSLDAPAPALMILANGRLPSSNAVNFDLTALCQPIALPQATWL